MLSIRVILPFYWTRASTAIVQAVAQVSSCVFAEDTARKSLPPNSNHDVTSPGIFYLKVYFFQTNRWRYNQKASIEKKHNTELLCTESAEKQLFVIFFSWRHQIFKNCTWNLPFVGKQLQSRGLLLFQCFQGNGQNPIIVERHCGKIHIPHLGPN